MCVDSIAYKIVNSLKELLRPPVLYPVTVVESDGCVTVKVIIHAVLTIGLLSYHSITVTFSVGTAQITKTAEVPIDVGYRSLTEFITSFTHSFSYCDNHSTYYTDNCQHCE